MLKKFVSYVIWTKSKVRVNNNNTTAPVTGRLTDQNEFYVAQENLL